MDAGDKLRATAQAGRDSISRWMPGSQYVRGSVILSTGASLLSLMTAPALAMDLSSFRELLPAINTREVVQLAIFGGAMGAAFFSAIYLIRQRGAITNDNDGLRNRVAELSTTVRRYDALLNFRDQRIVFWSANAKQAELIGSLPMETGAPDDRGVFMAFGRWLNPQSAGLLDQAIANLRENQKAFDLVVETQTGAPLEIQGRYGSGYALVRFMSSLGSQLEEARLRLENQRISAEHRDLLGLIDAVDIPVWIRGGDGRLKWVNSAYANAVEMPDADAAVRHARELLGTQAREEISRYHRSDRTFADQLSTVIRGNRHVLSVIDHVGTSGSSGLGH